MRSRVDWIDTGRGIGIILVVVGHSVIGLANANLVDQGILYRAVVDFIYCFHMPLLFFISGFVSNDRQKSFREFSLSVLCWSIYPYVLWSVILVGLQNLAGSAANIPSDLASLAYLASEPPLIMWFLYVLFMVRILDYAFDRLIRSESAPRFLMIFGFCVWLLACVFVDSSFLVHRLGFGLFFYELGRVSAKEPEHRWNFLLGYVPVRVFSIVVLSFLLALYGEITFAADPIYSVPLTGILGTVLALEIAHCLGSSSIGRALQMIGRYSMSIYVQHIIYSAFARSMIRTFYAEVSPGLLFLIMLIAGLVLPVLWQHLSDRLGLTSLLGIKPVIRPVHADGYRRVSASDRGTS